MKVTLTLGGILRRPVVRAGKKIFCLKLQKCSWLSLLNENFHGKCLILTHFWKELFTSREKKKKICSWGFLSKLLDSILENMWLRSSCWGITGVKTEIPNHLPSAEIHFLCNFEYMPLSHWRGSDGFLLSQGCVAPSGDASQLRYLQSSSGWECVFILSITSK